MAAIRAKDTKPELLLRAALRQAGITGYRLHRKDLPGRPDIAFIRWKVAVFVDGVFWHGHPDHWHPEKAASDYWRVKITRNIQRDCEADAALDARGWTVVRLWETEVRDDLPGCTERVLAALRAAGREIVSSDLLLDRKVKRQITDIP